MSSQEGIGVPRPPMEFNLYGTADEAKPLSRGVRTLLTKGFGVDKPLPRIPESDVTVTESRLPRRSPRWRASSAPTG